MVAGPSISLQQFGGPNYHACRDWSAVPVTVVMAVWPCQIRRRICPEGCILAVLAFRVVDLPATRPSTPGRDLVSWGLLIVHRE
jgi:hypothetical protein